MRRTCENDLVSEKKKKRIVSITKLYETRERKLRYLYVKQERKGEKASKIDEINTRNGLSSEMK